VAFNFKFTVIKNTEETNMFCGTEILCWQNRMYSAEREGQKEKRKEGGSKFKPESILWAQAVKSEWQR
jgi:hypothetical protein